MYSEGLDNKAYSGFSTAKDSNAFYRRNLGLRAKGLLLPSTLPLTEYTIRSSRVVGDIGKAGVAVDSVEDMKIL